MIESIVMIIWHPQVRISVILTVFGGLKFILDVISYNDVMPSYRRVSE